MPDIYNTDAQAAALPLPENIEQSPIWLARAIEWAAQQGATDVHLFPSEREAMMWARLDGSLVEVARYPSSYHQRMVARLKVMGQCTDYAGEVLLEGRFALGGADAAGGEARLSVMPTVFGDKAVIRLLPGAGKFRKLEELGFDAPLIDAMRETLDLPQGMILAVGASGSGKSTALYALLHDFFTRSARPRSVVTIEDPVEQTLVFASQINADHRRGVGFASGLRAVLRQDPEVIMIGEIRDAETAATALQAALTGHRILSSMHTLSAAEALVRLRQMDIPAYVIASAMAGVLSVRLAQVLCPDCRAPRPMTAAELALFPEANEWDTQRVYQSVGCKQCMGSGVRGRVGVGEWSVPTDATAQALYASAATNAIAETVQLVAGARAGVLRLLRNGKISVDETRRLGTLTSLNGGKLK